MSQARIPSHLRPVLKAAKTQGFTWVFTTRGHIQLLKPNGHVVAVFAGTPSDNRSFKNSLADARRGGLAYRKGC